jgi:hypothetical protein
MEVEAVSAIEVAQGSGGLGHNMKGLHFVLIVSLERLLSHILPPAD